MGAYSLVSFLWVVYGGLSGLLLLYSLMQVRFIWYFLRRKAVLMPAAGPFPNVLVQLPIFNEPDAAVHRLLTAVWQLEYPAHLLTIQILDDSTDGSADRLAQWLCEQQAAIPFQTQHIRRPHRAGYKAGALAYGLEQTEAPFIAIFDADFVPPPAFLKQTVGHFATPEIGFVQTRWGHLNRSQNLLTRWQALALDAHFTMEQGGRQAAGDFISFNGTAGIWRRAAIDAAGGWQTDTLTEDLDLALRAQSNGWRGVFLPHVAVPAELPATLPAYHTQQYRWMNGGAACFRKLAAAMWRQPGLTRAQRLHATLQLAGSHVYAVLFLLSVLSVPLALVGQAPPWVAGLLYAQVSWLILSLFYGMVAREQGLRYRQFISHFAGFMLLSTGMAFRNTVAVADAWRGRRLPFDRTPKMGQVAGGSSRASATWLSQAEWVLLVVFGAVAIYDTCQQQWGWLGFHALLTVAYGVQIMGKSRIV